MYPGGLSFEPVHFTEDDASQFFDFQTMKHVLAVTIPASITAILLHRENGLLAVTCDDLIVRVVDIETRRVVRELSGFRGTILDLVSWINCLFFLQQWSLTHSPL